jgi:hypothetical protein
MTPDLVADVTLYHTVEGGKTIPARTGYRCPCMPSRTEPLCGYDARLILGEPFFPGQKRRVGFIFTQPEAAAVMRDAGVFFLWDGRFVGEAIVVGASAGAATHG